ncbi:MAG TPA: hypothetical protein VFX01_07365 [Methylophilaceae bacterium]|nr:hypothetical protein [Methylophilaceae bacterium]
MSSNRDEGNWKNYKNTLRQQKRKSLDQADDDDKHARYAIKAREIDTAFRSECDEELSSWRWE